ncbi:hypothetical protein [Trinickia sp. EG282A]|uniref:hypothetical protein n=1 Tax=Trinickia sp. EG282A TaxID=3237013 RepID=UPI0034D2FB26
MKKTIAELIAETQRKKQEREALATALMTGKSEGDSISLVRDGGQMALVGPDASKQGAFRVTWFDHMEPIGHAEAATMRAAVVRALDEGYMPTSADGAAQVCEPDVGSVAGSRPRPRM